MRGNVVLFRRIPVNKWVKNNKFKKKQQKKNK